jgi:uncharacterized protein (TIGR00297 family)
MNLLLGFSLSALIAALAWRAGALNRSGALAAFLTGGLIFGFGGLSWAILLLTFFISSSILSRLFARRKASLDEKYAKGSRRDWGQVFANGGLGALLALLYALYPDQDWPWIAFIGAMAAVNADTWATEIGAFSRTPPRLIISGVQVEPGTSGGVTLLGYSAILGGAALIGLAGMLSSPAASNLSWILLAAAAGLAGSTADSLLGATLQAIYYCPLCKKETEKHPQHTCGTNTDHLRGWRWLDNDWVNFTCSLVGALSALAIWMVWGV